MDTQLLAAKQIVPARIESGFVDGYALRIGERATLIAESDGRAYGVVMEIPPDDVARLYAEASVADYFPESTMVETMGGTRVEATCYILPADKVAGTNKTYAKALLDIATELHFPDYYLEEIRKWQA